MERRTSLAWRFAALVPAIRSMHGERLYGKRFTVVGKQVHELTFQTCGAF